MHMTRHVSCVCLTSLCFLTSRSLRLHFSCVSLQCAVHLAPAQIYYPQKGHCLLFILPLPESITPKKDAVCNNKYPTSLFSPVLRWGAIIHTVGNIIISQWHVFIGWVTGKGHFEGQSAFNWNHWFCGTASMYTSWPLPLWRSCGGTSDPVRVLVQIGRWWRGVTNKITLIEHTWNLHEKFHNQLYSQKLARHFSFEIFQIFFPFDL